jgi:hypothetical protein
VVDKKRFWEIIAASGEEADRDEDFIVNHWKN